VISGATVFFKFVELRFNDPLVNSDDDNEEVDAGVTD
jgi:hypothetical protein